MPAHFERTKGGMKLIVSALVVFSACLCHAQPYFVSPAGNDANPGTLEEPFATLQRAQQAAREKHRNICLRGGTYYLPATLVLTAEDSGKSDAPVVFENYQDEQPVISGGVRLENLNWQPFTNGIFQAQVPADLQTEEIFVNGERQILARYRTSTRRRNTLTGSRLTRFLRSARRGGRTRPAVIFTRCIRLCGAISPGASLARTRTIR
jgi:hypothetical protein